MLSILLQEGSENVQGHEVEGISLVQLNRQLSKPTMFAMSHSDSGFWEICQGICGRELQTDEMKCAHDSCGLCMERTATEDVEDSANDSHNTTRLERECCHRTRVIWMLTVRVASNH